MVATTNDVGAGCAASGDGDGDSDDAIFANLSCANKRSEVKEMQRTHSAGKVPRARESERERGSERARARVQALLLSLLHNAHAQQSQRAW